MTSIFKDKVAVVTGASSGIGRNLALQLAAAGARVAVTDINEARLQQTIDLNSGNIGKIKPYVFDVSNRAAFFDFADQAIEDFGGVDYIFNNAGVTVFGLAQNVDIDDMEWLLGINLWGMIYGSKAFLPHFLKKKSGHIINMSSMFGFVGVRGQSAYCTSKFGARGFTESLIQELKGTGVSVSSVHPGGIATNIANDGKFNDGGVLYSTKEEAVEVSRRVLKMPPQKAARIILSAVARKKCRIRVGADAVFFDYLARLFPTGYPVILKMIGG